MTAARRNPPMPATQMRQHTAADLDELTAAIAAADLAWSAELGDPPSEPRYIQALAKGAMRALPNLGDRESEHWIVMPDGRPGIDVAGDVDPADVREIPADELDVTTYPANFRASAAKLGAKPHENTYRAGVRHGYLMAADAMDEMVAEIQRLRAARRARRAAGHP